MTPAQIELVALLLRKANIPIAPRSDREAVQHNAEAFPAYAVYEDGIGSDCDRGPYFSINIDTGTCWLCTDWERLMSIPEEGQPPDPEREKALYILMKGLV